LHHEVTTHELLHQSVTALTKALAKTMTRTTKGKKGVH
jgi:hypothetical protein